jgi:hypothetical protein
MLGSINPNQGSNASKPVEPTLPAEAKIATKATSEVQPPEDTVELSSVSQQFQAYRAALKNEPDVRPDVMEKIKALLSKDKNFPPLIVMQGMGRLFGNLGSSEVKPTEE